MTRIPCDELECRQQLALLTAVQNLIDTFRMQNLEAARTGLLLIQRRLNIELQQPSTQPITEEDASTAEVGYKTLQEVLSHHMAVTEALAPLLALRC